MLYSSQDRAKIQALLSFQINNVDSYQATPVESFDRCQTILQPALPFKHVPIIRIFGKTEAGQNICAHVHGAYPYLYVKYPESMGIDQSLEYISDFIKSTNSAIAASYRAKHPEKSTSNYVADILFCKGTPFFGYHVGWQYYLKISMLHPIYMSRLTDLLQKGLIMHNFNQTYEAHCPYILQFFTDFNLYGCSMIHVADARFRAPLPQHLQDTDDNCASSDSAIWDDLNVPSSKVLDRSEFPKMSYCSLEVDVNANDILNRYLVKERPIHTEIFESLTKVSPAVSSKLLPSLSELWIDEEKRFKERGIIEEPRQSLESEKQGPIHKDWPVLSDLKSAVQKRIEKDREERMGIPPSQDSIKSGRVDNQEVPTTFQTVNRLLKASPLSYSGEDLNSSFEFTKSDLQSSPEYPSQSKASSGNLSESSQEPGKRHATGSLPTVRPLKRLSFAPDMSKESSGNSVRKQGRVTSFSSIVEIPSGFFDEESSIISSNIESIIVLLRKDVCLPQPCTIVSRSPSLSVSEVEALPIEYPDPHYSDISDNPKKPFELAGRLFRPPWVGTDYLPLFNFSRDEFNYPINTSLSDVSFRSWRFLQDAPSRRIVERTYSGTDELSFSGFPHLLVNSSGGRPSLGPDHSSQIRGPTQVMHRVFKQSSNKAMMPSIAREMSCFLVEIHVNTRDKLLPDPKQDPVMMIFWRFLLDAGRSNSDDENFREGLILAGDEMVHEQFRRLTKAEISVVDDELSMFTRLESIVRERDPDILAGYELHNSSWGFILERSNEAYNYDLQEELARVREESKNRRKNRWGYTHGSAFHITGRHMFNIWRVLRKEVNLLQYTLESVAFSILNIRTPSYSHQAMSHLHQSSSFSDKAELIQYFFNRLKLELDIIESRDLITRASEQARLIGIDFSSVLTRGSQYRVESFLFRLAKPESFVLVSPSKQQVSQQNALQCLPLIMEPLSAYYKGPLLVLDFQSLYPSIIMAYNYCYSTCLGRVHPWRGKNKLGSFDYDLKNGTLELLKDHINISPNGMIFVKSNVRKSLLSRMLEEVLGTRVMVRSGMKHWKDDRDLTRLQNNRQLVLKLVANVTYGYTSASFSGRMPCVEIADSIVETARQTLEEAIEVVRTTEKWGAQVVYGDTDSMFVYLPGRSKDQAFDIGNEIAKVITDINPAPIKLKFEKVYLPSFLVAKKRYVGNSYEYQDQKLPKFDAKGIETVRRDGTPAEQKIEEKALRLFFETADFSIVKRYFQSQCQKIMSNRVSVPDFCFAKEVKIGTYKETGTLPPGAMISTKKMQEDPQAEPQYGERVPYLVIAGPSGSRLVDRCVTPEDYLRSGGFMRLDSEYYIKKNLIPPLQRLFCLAGARVTSWYDDMPRRFRLMPASMGPPVLSATVGDDVSTSRTFRPTLLSHLKSAFCVCCETNSADSLDESGLCNNCRQDRQSTAYVLSERLRQRSQKLSDLETICRSCSNIQKNRPILCTSHDCPVYYSRIRALEQLQQSQSVSARVLSDGSDLALDLQW